MGEKRIIPDVLDEHLSTVTRQLLRDLLKAVAGLCFNLGTIVFLVEVLDVAPSVAPVISLTVLLFFAYVVTDKWTFKGKDSPRTIQGHLRLFGHFVFAYAGGQAVKYTLYLLVLPFVPYVIGWPIASGSGFILSFGLSRRAWLRNEPR